MTTSSTSTEPLPVEDEQPSASAKLAVKSHSTRRRGGSQPGERRGGRRKGTPNRVNMAVRLRVLEEADPIGKLIDAAETGTISLGEQRVALSADQYLGVLRELRRLAVPDAKSAPVRLDGVPEVRTAADV